MDDILIVTPHHLNSFIRIVSDKNIFLSTSVTNLSVKMENQLTDFDIHMLDNFLPPQKHQQTASNTRPGRCRETCPSLCLIQGGRLKCTPNRELWQVHPETTVHPVQRCQDPDDNVKTPSHHLHPEISSLPPCPTQNYD